MEELEETGGDVGRDNVEHGRKGRSRRGKEMRGITHIAGMDVSSNPDVVKVAEERERDSRSASIDFQAGIERTRVSETYSFPQSRSQAHVMSLP
jgi:hypothetical protein